MTALGYESQEVDKEKDQYHIQIFRDHKEVIFNLTNFKRDEDIMMSGIDEEGKGVVILLGSATAIITKKSQNRNPY